MSDQHSLTCRICGKRMVVQEQPRDWKHEPPLLLITCKTPGCPMEGYTLGAATYEQLDLTPYLQTASARYQAWVLTFQFVNDAAVEREATRG